MGLKRKRRVVVHLIDPAPGVELPSVEGLLVSRRNREYVVAVPKLRLAAESPSKALETRLLVIPRERVAFYEVA